MEASLEDRQQQDPYRSANSDLKVSAPLSNCVERLKEKQNKIAQVHRERFEQIKSKCIVVPCKRWAYKCRTGASARILLLSS